MMIMKQSQNSDEDRLHSSGCYRKRSTNKTVSDISVKNSENNKNHNITYHCRDHNHSQQCSKAQPPAIPQRLFMNTLLKHTAIALAIIIPLAAYSAFATSPSNTSSNTSKSSPFVSLENENSDDRPEVNSQYKQNDRLANSDTRYINTLGVPVYDDDIFLATENLQQVDLSNTDSAIVDTDDAPISARN